MELADVSDSKSDGSDTVPVRPRSSALIFCLKEYYKCIFELHIFTKFIVKILCKYMRTVRKRAFKLWLGCSFLRPQYLYVNIGTLYIICQYVSKIISRILLYFLS